MVVVITQEEAQEIVWCYGIMNVSKDDLIKRFHHGYQTIDEILTKFGDVKIKKKMAERSKYRSNAQKKPKLPKQVRLTKENRKQIDEFLKKPPDYSVYEVKERNWIKI